MSEFDEARQAAVAWIRERMDRHGLTLDDLEAAGCFDAASSASDDVGSSPPPPAVNAVDAMQLAAPPAPGHAEPRAGTVLYRNALGQTWDGIGEPPDWLQRAVNAGQSMEFYRVE
ncbi:H-NS histone family protein [Cupriavidus respiraculi]|uniref:H-NS family nucleoid-associated regulatory protein n=1 Tax=Cupriavidus respiraculi TaxID=195930 RepID=UPI001C96FCEC|nr:H-NS family nucleoid-associated regulatory protein [Cupriavidus respiraculi]MBY4948301.1 H-NS histone family protein [Cupriavidus respiraculi]